MNPTPTPPSPGSREPSESSPEGGSEGHSEDRSAVAPSSASPSSGEPSPPPPSPGTGAAPSPPFLVYGLNLVVCMKKEEEIEVLVRCPHGQPMQYGVVVAVGDGFDPQASQFRSMPPIGSLITFEETPEGIEGQYLFIGDDEFRVLHLDVITVGFPPA